MIQAKVLDERVTANGVTEYLLQIVADFPFAPVWIVTNTIKPEDLEPESRKAIFGGSDAAEYGFDENGNRL